MPKKPRYSGAIDLSSPIAAAPVKKDTGVDLSQFAGILSQSWQKKQANDPTPGMAFDFPEDAIDTVKSRFRQAARQLDVGVAFETGNPQNGVVRLVVEARQKKQMPARKSAEAGNLPAPTNGAAKQAAAMPAAGGKRK